MKSPWLTCCILIQHARERVKGHGQVTEEIKLDLKQLEQRASLEKLTLNSNGCKVLSLSLETATKAYLARAVGPHLFSEALVLVAQEISLMSSSTGAHDPTTHARGT